MWTIIAKEYILAENVNDLDGIISVILVDKFECGSDDIFVMCGGICSANRIIVSIINRVTTVSTKTKSNIWKPLISWSIRSQYSSRR